MLENVSTPLQSNKSEVINQIRLLFLFSTYTACVNKNATTFTIFFLRNWHKILIRIFNNIRDTNYIFYGIFVLCDLACWFKSYSKSCEVPLNLFGLVTKEPVWVVHQLVTISYSSLLGWSLFCKTFLNCIMWGCKVRLSFVIWLHDDGLK